MPFMVVRSGVRCIDGICVCGPDNWTFFGTPLFWSYWDLLSGPRSGRICAEYLGAAVGPPWLVTEAPDHQQTIKHLTSDSSRVRLVAADFSSALAYSLIYLLKRMGLKLHPCLTPRPGGKKSVFFANFNHTLVVCVHGFYNIVCFPTTPHSINLYSRPSIQSMRRLYLCFGLFVCQLVCAGWICDLSYSNLVKSQFDIYSVHCSRWGKVPVCW